MFFKILPFFLLHFLCIGIILIESSPIFDSKIIGGTNADIKDFPYQLSLRFKNKHGCGASIISSKWALTASHCMEDFKQSDVKDLTVVSGSTYRVTGGIIHNIEKFIMHPNYNKESADYDFALLKVFTPFEIGREGVNTISLSADEPKEGEFGNITGWGVLHNGVQNLPNTLQKLTVPIVNRESCKKSYEGLNIITDRMICAGFSEGQKDSCIGDSGGPLVSNGRQIGVISFGYGCAQPNYPGVYANVAYALEWIKENTDLK